MKKISTWARGHKWPARILIIVSFILLNITGILTGRLLEGLNVFIPPFIFFLPVALFIYGILFYPLKSEKSRFSPGRFYKRQKTMDFILASSAFCMVICICNDRT